MKKIKEFFKELGVIRTYICILIFLSLLVSLNGDDFFRPVTYLLLLVILLSTRNGGMRPSV